MTKQFIITDQCYIMDEIQYDGICNNFDCDFEGRTFPLFSTHKKTKKEITFYKIKGTPHGDGGMTYKGQSIGVDAGMLCIAGCREGWDDEFWGATFETLAEARKAFPNILRRF